MSPGHELQVRKGHLCIIFELNQLDCSCFDCLLLFLLFPLFFYHPQARAYCRVAVAALNTLAGYIDWVSLTHITCKNSQLLEMLCLLLSEPELQLEAAECLVIAVSRKVSVRENNHVSAIMS